MATNEYVTKQDLTGLEQRLEAKIEATEQSLDGQIKAVEQRLDTKIEATEQRLSSQFKEALGASEQRVVDQLTELMRDIETKLLTAFHTFAKSNATHLQKIDATSAYLEDRMNSLELRVLDLENDRRKPS